MDTADFATHYFLGDTQVDPPAPTGDEDADIANYEDFVLQDGLVARQYCTADGTTVYAPSAHHAQEMRCGQGHRWLHVAPEPSMPGSTSGWRQVS